MERQSIRIPDVIQKKRDKYELEPEEIKFFIDEMVKGCIEPVQLGKSGVSRKLRII
jgi:thymidine phosphorylase